MRSPLAPAESMFSPFPSPLQLVHYPLVANSVRLLCEERPRASLAASLGLLRQTYRLEGLKGLFRGGHLYLLHQVLRDSCRRLAEESLLLLEARLGMRPLAEEGESLRRKRYLGRLFVKYWIDGLFYPVLLASTRIVMLKSEESTWKSVQEWCREEGIWSLFSGLTASLLSTAFEEAMELILGACVDRSKGNVDVADKLVLKACGSSVASVFTSPINYVSVIQRCQSPSLPGFTKPRPLGGIIWALPWRSSFNQLVLFSGILGLNVRLIQWKIELQEEETEE